MQKGLYKCLGINTYESGGILVKRTTIELPDELDRRLRVKVAELYGGKKGALGEAIREAVELWLQKHGG